MRSQTRALTAHEVKEWDKNIPVLRRRRRSLAKTELAAGRAEILEFEVVKAWYTDVCGPDCCPAWWFLETEECEFVQVVSYELAPVWAHPQLGDGFYFPGNQVRVDRWPATHRVISAVATGDPLPARDTQLTYLSLLRWGPLCRYCTSAELPEELRAELQSDEIAPPAPDTRQ